MKTVQESSICALIDQVKAIAASPANLVRGEKRPNASFAFETPIAQSKIFGYDVNQLFSDSRAYFIQILTEKLWRWNTFPKDELPLTEDVNAWLGHYPEYSGLGLDITFNHEGVPLIRSEHPLSMDADLSLLKPYEVHNFTSWGWNSRILRWYDDLSRLSAGRVPIIFGMIWWRGCLDLAIAMRGFDAFLADTSERPEFVHDLLKWIIEQRCRWWEGYYTYFNKEHGPCPVADDWVNVPFISPRIFREFVLPRYFDIEAFHGGISSFHTCGNTVPIQRDIFKLKSLTGLELSAWTDLGQSLANIPTEKSLLVNLHPNDILLTSRAEMQSKLQVIIDQCGAREYSIHAGGLTPITTDPRDYYRQINQWLDVAELTLAPVRQKRK